LSEKKELEAKIDKIVEKEKGDKEQKIEEEKGEPIALAEMEEMEVEWLDDNT